VIFIQSFWFTQIQVLAEEAEGQRGIKKLQSIFDAADQRLIQYVEVQRVRKKIQLTSLCTLAFLAGSLSFSNSNLIYRYP